MDARAYVGIRRDATHDEYRLYRLDDRQRPEYFGPAYAGPRVAAQACHEANAALDARIAADVESPETSDPQIASFSRRGKFATPKPRKER